MVVVMIVRDRKAIDGGSRRRVSNVELELPCPRTHHADFLSPSAYEGRFSSIDLAKLLEVHISPGNCFALSSGTVPPSDSFNCYRCHFVGIGARTHESTTSS